MQTEGVGVEEQESRSHLPGLEQMSSPLGLLLPSPSPLSLRPPPPPHLLFFLLF